MKVYVIGEVVCRAVILRRVFFDKSNALRCLKKLEEESDNCFSLVKVSVGDLDFIFSEEGIPRLDNLMLLLHGNKSNIK
jgi:hypothetical protein